MKNRKMKLFNLTLDGDDEYEELIQRSDVYIEEDRERWSQGECYHIVIWREEQGQGKQKELPTTNGMPSRSGPPLDSDEILKRCFQSDSSEDPSPESSDSSSRPSKSSNDDHNS